MRMRGKKYLFNRRDTWNLNSTLDTFICAALKKFMEVKHSDKSEWFGVPVGSLYQHGMITEEQYNESDNLEPISKIWEEVLNKMIYAFDAKNEPNILDYKFEHDWVQTGENYDGEELYTIKLKEGTEAESKRYDEDMTAWIEKVKEGRDLFVKFYDNLWW